MVNNNNTIPIEVNKKPFETVYELKSEIPTYEEFMKTYQSDERLEALSEAEWQDRVLNDPQYGPGASQSKSDQQKTAASVGIGAGLVVTTIVCPPLGGALSTAYGVAGSGLQFAGMITDDDGLRDAGEIIGNGAAIGGIAGLGMSALNPKHACTLCKTPGGKEIWTLKR